MQSIGRNSRHAGWNETVSRDLSMSDGLGGQSGLIEMAYFTGVYQAPVTTAWCQMGNTGIESGPTIVRFGLYRVDHSSHLCTLVASTPNDTSLGSDTDSPVSKALSAAYFIEPGQLYAACFFRYSPGKAPGKMQVHVLADGGLNAIWPFVSKQVSGQTDLPATIADAALSNVAWSPWIGFT